MGYGQYSGNSHGKQNPLRYETKTNRRQVFPTGEIPHKWAHQTQESARNPQGNLYFKGATIYSYRDSWPLARIYKCTKSARVLGRDTISATVTLVLTSANKYSMTTTGHQCDVNRAASHLRQIAVPFVVPGDHQPDKRDHDANLAYLAAEMKSRHEQAGRVMTALSVTWRAEECAQLHKAMADYMIFFGIRRKMPALLSFAAAFERARRIENPDPASLDKRERASAARKVRLRDRDEYLAEQRETLKRGAFYHVGATRNDWRLFGAFDGGWRNGRSVYGESVMLRVNGDEIETSMGARIPASHAPRLWRVIERCRDTGIPYQHNGHTEHAGDYRVDSIDADGTLRAGCHVIPYSELAGMARKLGLAS